MTRDLARKKPFSSSGSGYRDALIWLSLVSLLGESSEAENAAFITRNSKDFGEAPRLHEDLLSDLNPVKTVDLYNTLEQFNAAQIVPKLEHLEAVLELVQGDEFKQFSLLAWIDETLLDVLNQDPFGALLPRS